MNTEYMKITVYLLQSNNHQMLCRLHLARYSICTLVQAHYMKLSIVIISGVTLIVQTS